VRFLIDNALSRIVAEGLRQAGHDAVRVRDYGIHKAEDEVVFERAAGENRVIVSADTGFGTLLAIRQRSEPSVILFQRSSQRNPDAQVKLLLSNLPNVTDLLDQGSIIVFEETRVRSRPLPISRDK